MSRFGTPPLATRQLITGATAPVVDAARDGISIHIGGGSGNGNNGKAMRHPVTGCRADTLFGVWLMPQEQLASMTAAAWGIIESGKLAEIKARSDELALDEETEPLVTVDDDGIAFLNISGPLTKTQTSFSSVMGGTSYARIREQLREVRKLAAEGKVRGAFVDADSWGGTAEGCAEAAASIRKTDDVVPVAFHAEDKCTSAMQWLGSMGRQLTGGRGATFGSVGAMLALLDRSENFKRQGLRPVIVTTGPDKSVGAPGTEITDEQRGQLQRHIEQVGEPFLMDVQAQRRLTPDQLGEVRRAGLHVGADALRLGLCDKVCSREQALADFKATIASGAQSGGTPGSPAPAAPGVLNMPRPFTDSEITRARTLPNCAAVTADNAPELVLAAAEATARDLTARTGERDTAQRERDEARKLAPLVPEGELLAARHATAAARIQAMTATGRLNAAHAQRLTAMIGTAEKPEVSVFTGARGDTLIERTLAVFDTEGGAAVNLPANATQTVTGAQQGTANGAAVDPRIAGNPLAGFVGAPGGNGAVNPATAAPVNPAASGAQVAAVADPRASGVVTAAQAGTQQGNAYRDEQLRQRGIKTS